MSYSEERFKSILSRMALFQKIAAQNGYELKDLLIKKVGADEELAEAVIAAWKAGQAEAAGPARPAGISDERFQACLRDMESFQRLAALQGSELNVWLQANCGIDAGTAQALIDAAGSKPEQKSGSLLQVLSRPEKTEAASDARRDSAPGARARRRPEGDDVEITISGLPDESAAVLIPPAAEHPDLACQIEKLHAIADTAQQAEPVQLILDLQETRLKKNYLQNPVSPDEKERAERLLREREEQRRKLLQLETKLEEAHQAAAALRSNPPRLFGREEHRTKLRETEESIERIERQIAALTAREAERQTAYLAAVSSLERHAKAQRGIERQYGEDQEKFSAAKDVIVQALRWAQLELPPEVRTCPVMEQLGWYESFFKAFSDNYAMPVHGWIKAFDIAGKLARDYPLWRGKIDSIHFVLDGEMKGLKDSVRLFLDGFVAQLQAPYSAVCQLEVARSEAHKTGGQAVQELVAHRERELLGAFDGGVVEFCTETLPDFFTIQAVSEYLNFELNVRRFFDYPPEPAGARAEPDKEGYAKMFEGLAQESARRLEACFAASDEIARLRGTECAGADLCSQARDIIRADFENLFTASRERLKRY